MQGIRGQGFRDHKGGRRAIVVVGVPEQRGPRHGIDHVAALALDRRDLVLVELIGGWLAREVRERGRDGEKVLIRSFRRHTRNGGAPGAEVGVRQLQEIPYHGREIARSVEGDIHGGRRKDLRTRDRRRAAQGDPVGEPGIRRGVERVGHRKIGAQQVVGLGQLLRQVLEHVPAPGRRIVEGRGLPRADDAVHEEGHDRDHQDARDAERHRHLDQRHSMRGLLHERRALAPSECVCGRNHGEGLTEIRSRMAPFPGAARAAAGACWNAA